MSIHHLWHRSDLNSPSEWLGSRRRLGRARDDEGHAVGALQKRATASKGPADLTPQPESRGPRYSKVATLERLAGRTGAEFLPSGTLRAIVEWAAEGGDREARALLEPGALSDNGIEL
jgi:hypothetical protein